MIPSQMHTDKMPDILYIALFPLMSEWRMVDVHIYTKIVYTLFHFRMNRTLFHFRINEPYFIFGESNLRTNKYSDLRALLIFEESNIRNNEQHPSVLGPHQVVQYCLIQLSLQSIIQKHLHFTSNISQEKIKTWNLNIRYF